MSVKSGAVASALLALAAISAFAGGRPDQVVFPQGYATSFRNYVTANRASGKPEIAKVYANGVAQRSAGAGGALAAGSVLVMEIYKAETDTDGNPVRDSDGNFRIGDLAGVAVMEKRADWPAEYPAAERAGNWGFALYGPAGQPRENDLVWAACHQPFATQDFVVTYAKLVAAGQ